MYYFPCSTNRSIPADMIQFIRTQSRVWLRSSSNGSQKAVCSKKTFSVLAHVLPVRIFPVLKEVLRIVHETHHAKYRMNYVHGVSMPTHRHLKTKLIPSLPQISHSHIQHSPRIIPMPTHAILNWNRPANRSSSQKVPPLPLYRVASTNNAEEAWLMLNYCTDSSIRPHSVVKRALVSALFNRDRP